LQYNTDQRLVTSEDFKLLENMNVVTKEKYAEMTEVAKGLTLFMEDLQKKCAL
jgi:hypothetical protein